MSAEERFDSFYSSSRMALVQQTFALTGDLPAAQAAVPDAYAMAWQHWRKVGSLEDPLDWVRPRAWRLAQRRHTGRLWHRNRGLTEHDRAVLEALAKLPSLPRRVLLLTQLAAVPLADAARELAITRDAAERHLQTGIAQFSVHLDTDSAVVRSHLHRLATTVGEVPLPRATIVRRAGRKRGQARMVIGVAAAVVATIASGAFASEPQTSSKSPGNAESSAQVVLPGAGGSGAAADSTVPDAASSLPTADDLLDTDQIGRLGSAHRWHVVGTSDNTGGDGINMVCQRTRFADPDGLAALVRRFEAGGRPQRRAVQTVETSRTIAEARRTFATTVEWFVDCQESRLQLLHAYRVDGVGAQAQVLVLRSWEHPMATYSIAIARTGRVTTTTSARTVAAAAAPLDQIVQSLADSVAMVCDRDGTTTCEKHPAQVASAPPSSGSEPGALTAVDLPPVGRVRAPWAGTALSRPEQNPAATTCDRADFARAGATRVRSRTFLIPEAKLPARFGLSETYGVFGGPRAAQRFVDTVLSRMAGCEDRDLTTKVTTGPHRKSPASESWAWRLTTEVSKRETVAFRVGFVRAGNTVAQLTFAPTAHEDMSTEEFSALLERAGERLREVSSGS